MSQLTDAAAPASRITEDAAVALIRTNRRRAKVRRIIGFASIPLLLAALLFTGKLLSMYGFAHAAITAHVAGDAEGTSRAALGQLPLNWFEPYKAPYNLGVGLAAGVQLPQARARLEEALPLAPGLEVCPVQENLALVIEAMGDQAAEAKDTETARGLWMQALDVVVSAPDGCHTAAADAASPEPTRVMTEELAETERRIRDKLNPPNENPESQSGQDEGESEGSPEEQPEETPSEEKLQDIQDKLQEGEREREEHESGGDEDGGNGTDRPW